LLASWPAENRDANNEFVIYRMNLFQFLRKNKQDDASAEGAYRSRAEEESSAVRARSKRSPDRNSTPVDPVLPEKKRARRRLIGAVALVLAAVIGLPMVLDTEPKPLADDIAIQIPSMDKPGRSSTSHQSASASAKAGFEQNSAAASTQVSAPEADIPKPASPVPANDNHKPSVANAVSPPNPELKPATKPQKQADNKAEDSERARAILEGKSDAKVADAKAGTEKKSGQYLVQVAALASQEKVNELQGKLKSAGIASHTQKVATQTGERIRVRIGPFAGKDEADKMRARLQKIGLNGSLVPA
jgi:DedD protein